MGTGASAAAAAAAVRTKQIIEQPPPKPKTYAPGFKSHDDHLFGWFPLWFAATHHTGKDGEDLVSYGDGTVICEQVHTPICDPAPLGTHEVALITVGIVASLIIGVIVRELVFK